MDVNPHVGKANYRGGVMDIKKYSVDTCGSEWCGLRHDEGGFIYHVEDIEPLLKELAELRAYKEAAESQKPVYFWKEIGETDWMECGKDWYWKCVDSPEHDTKLLYANPIPTDKPVTRQYVIDVLLSTRGQSEGVTADAILGLLSDKASATVPDEIQLLQRDELEELLSEYSFDIGEDYRKAADAILSRYTLEHSHDNQ